MREIDDRLQAAFRADGTKWWVVPSRSKGMTCATFGDDVLTERDWSRTPPMERRCDDRVR
ncbi:hypothetical protein [Pseudonocardia sp.]|uniref:hypothetical protein n=1 Tax=Pseudonocardia sp. TaxID=60912 RepID=UPI0031FD817F